MKLSIYKYDSYSAPSGASWVGEPEYIPVTQLEIQNSSDRQELVFRIGEIQSQFITVTRAMTNKSFTINTNNIVKYEDFVLAHAKLSMYQNGADIIQDFYLLVECNNKVEFIDRKSI